MGCSLSNIATTKRVNTTKQPGYSPIARKSSAKRRNDMDCRCDNCGRNVPVNFIVRDEYVTARICRDCHEILSKDEETKEKEE